MKRMFLLLLSLFIIIAALSGCGNAVSLNDRSEVYNFDFGYYFYIPKEYEDKISEISVGNTTIVQYTEQVMLMVQAENYYNSLSNQEKSEHSRSEYSYGSELFDSTFNNTDYMLEYFEKHIQSIVASKRITQLSVQEINGSAYWVCDYELFDQKVNTTTLATEEIYKGEGKIYFHINNGIIYLITVSANDVHLSSLPDALNFIENYHIGTKSNNLIFYIWLIIGVLIIVTLVWVLKSFVTIELEDVTAETATLQLDTIKEMFKDSRYYSLNSGHDNELLYYRLDTILERNDEESFDMDARIEQNKIVMKKLDELLEAQYATEQMAGKSQFYGDALFYLDEILGRVETDVKTARPIERKEEISQPGVDFEDTIPIRKDINEAVVNEETCVNNKSEDNPNALKQLIKKTENGIMSKLKSFKDSLKSKCDERRERKINLESNGIGQAPSLSDIPDKNEINDENHDINTILDSIIRGEKQ